MINRMSAFDLKKVNDHPVSTFDLRACRSALPAWEVKAHESLLDSRIEFYGWRVRLYHRAFLDYSHQPLSAGQNAAAAPPEAIVAALPPDAEGRKALWEKKRCAICGAVV
jgi:hypothetical protein